MIALGPGLALTKEEAPLDKIANRVLDNLKSVTEYGEKKGTIKPHRINLGTTGVSKTTGNTGNNYEGFAVLRPELTDEINLTVKSLQFEYPDRDEVSVAAYKMVRELKTPEDRREFTEKIGLYILAKEILAAELLGDAPANNTGTVKAPETVSEGAKVFQFRPRQETAEPEQILA
jgi:hypothetical protein